MAGEKQATRGAESQQAYQTKTFSEGRGHFEILSGFLVGFLAGFPATDGVVITT